MTYFNSQKKQNRKPPPLENSASFQFTSFPIAVVLIQILNDASIRKLEPKPNVIRLGLQSRDSDTGGLHSHWKLDSLCPWFLIVSAELANLVVHILMVNADTEVIPMPETDRSECGVMRGTEFPREVAVVPSSSPATIATLYKVKTVSIHSI